MSKKFRTNTRVRVEFTDKLCEVKPGTIGVVMPGPAVKDSYPFRELIAVSWDGYGITYVDQDCLVALPKGKPTYGSEQAAAVLEAVLEAVRYYRSALKQQREGVQHE